MAYLLNASQVDELLNSLSDEYQVYAPKRYVGGGRFSDTDCVRYGEIQSVNEIEFDVKSQYSFKEILTPISQILFYFTEDSVKEPDGRTAGAVIFLRSCDLHGLKRLDEMYLHNGNPDYYYEKCRNHVKFVLMGCEKSFESCFCVDMGTNKSDNYDLSIDRDGDNFVINCNWDELTTRLDEWKVPTLEAEPKYVTENTTKVSIPENLSPDIVKSTIWNEYDLRCINCGRCTLVCPTCTCFTMQDIFYTDNGKAGERRRVQASCMVDGYTDVAGGGAYRRKNGERMRFKVMHKVYDFKQRTGYPMCVGCGRCDDICPEYISYSHILNKLEDGMKEVAQND